MLLASELKKALALGVTTPQDRPESTPNRGRGMQFPIGAVLHHSMVWSRKCGQNCRFVVPKGLMIVAR
jgi:hypothetical protein